MPVMVRARALGYSVGEVPVTFVDRIFEDSKLGAKESGLCLQLCEFMTSALSLLSFRPPP